MSLPNIFTKEISDKIIQRISNLNPDTQPAWGKMNASQMLAHCNVVYEMVYEDKHSKPNAFVKFILKLLVKEKVVGEKPYGHNLKTAPQFIMPDSKNFEDEKKRLIDFINRTQDLGEDHFDNKENLSFGILDKTEWNNMFYKHLDHHLTQFGV